ncbi:carboxylesterase/lipase family protein [Mycobacterium sp. MFM001]|uniref:carboxylesterase/lipase family protein n=1 Tax=Mycobacterium sp. MFM001 TaxID=2049453 RepID=UPI000E2E841E|nr:carboxylesterase/lipase family protein [Mycobacterium sp. MFM001]
MHGRTVCTATASGLVEGFSRDGVTRWRSIPYAEPPVGALRLKAPRPIKPWEGVLGCHRFRCCAPQARKYTMVGLGKFQPISEDCLTLNVVAPDTGFERALPVMLFIHGGAYFLGSSATPVYDGASLARKGCVFVSVNYRLGALGAVDLSSLSTDEFRIDDNLYLRDLVMALRWVRENIASFGGDPDAVTIFGESAGAHAVATLLAVPAAEELFARAISESPARGLVSSREESEEYAKKFATILGARPRDAAAVLMTAPPSDLVAALDHLITQESRNMPGAYPVGPTYGTDYLPLDPMDALRSGKAHRVPLMVGNNAEEAKLFTRFLKLLPTNEPRIELLLATVGSAEREQITAAYPSYPKAAGCIELGGDFTFGSIVWQIADAHSAYAPVYVYRYDYAPRTLRWSGLGATHATELLAVFDVYRTRFGRLLSAAGDRRSALRITEEVQARWCAFARTGAPGAGWPNYTSADRAVMIFDRTSRVEYDPLAVRRQVWQHFEVSRR